MSFERKEMFFFWFGFFFERGRVRGGVKEKFDVDGWGDGGFLGGVRG